MSTHTTVPSDEDLERQSAAALEPSSNAAVDEHGDDLPSQGLLSFYDNLRDRVLEAAESRDGRFSPRVVETLLLVPDVFMLLLRLSLDREVPRSARVLLGGALAYFVLPFDLWPEGIVGPVGYTDDLVLALAVLSQAFGQDLEPWTEKYWSGREPVRKVMGDVLQAAQSLLGSNLYGRLQKLLARRGVELEAAGAEGTHGAVG